jgi:hypothetical protein
LAEVLALVRNLGGGGGVENAADTQGAVEQEAADALPGLFGFALQQGVHRADRLAEVVEEIAHAQAHRARHHAHIGVGQRFGEAAVHRIVEPVDLAIEFLPRVVGHGLHGRRRQGGVGDRVVGFLLRVDRLEIALGIGLRGIGRRGFGLRGVANRHGGRGIRWRSLRLRAIGSRLRARLGGIGRSVRRLSGGFRSLDRRLVGSAGSIGRDGRGHQGAVGPRFGGRGLVRAAAEQQQGDEDGRVGARELHGGSVAAGFLKTGEVCVAGAGSDPGETQVVAQPVGGAQLGQTGRRAVDGDIAATLGQQR